MWFGASFPTEAIYRKTKNGFYRSLPQAIHTRLPRAVTVQSTVKFLMVAKRARIMRRLCLGGSFNPIHVGHVICARFAAEAAGFDGVRLIPSASNPHKPNANLAPADLRVAMINAATANDPFFLLDTVETRRGGTSYTFDTASALIDAGEAAPVSWLIGTDLLPRLHTWHRFDELISVVTFVVMKRAGQLVDFESCDSRVRSICKTIVDVPQIEISSTLIRERVSQRKSIDGLVHPGVQRIINNASIYRNT